jgi:hypothetical protein|tara:strand:+ start:1648 stop:2100 length:453 start_codon:yes stop_codon:yes gene_type:complete
MIQLITAGISAYASLQAGKAREDAARIDAFNTETERVQGQKLALQQAAERRREFDMATEANVSMFYASGRDVGSDRSIEAFLAKQKEIAATDLGRIASQSRAEASARTREAMALRRGGRNARRASMLQAAGTMAQGIQDYSETAATGGSK